jgi:hypothetical protein
MDIPFLVCRLFVLVMGYVSSFYKEPIFTDLLEDASANPSHRLVFKDLARVSTTSNINGESGETLAIRYSYYYILGAAGI